MELEWLVGKCLAKDLNSRYQNSSELVVDLRNLHDKLKSGKSTILTPQALSQVTVKQPAEPAGDFTAHPLVKYRVIEHVERPDDSIRYIAEDTELHRSVAIRVLPQTAEQQVERAQRRKQSLALAVGAVGVLLTLIFAFFPLFRPAKVTEVPLRRFTLPTEGIPQMPSISPDGRHVAYLTGVVDTRLGSKPSSRDSSFRRPSLNAARLVARQSIDCVPTRK